MALRNIVKIGDDNERSLHIKARKVEKFDERLATLAADMLETMREFDGIGLAAPQIGILKRMFVMNVIPEEGDFVIINPEFLSIEDENIVEVVGLEGCLSLPHMYGQVKRKQKVKIRYQDLQGDFHEMTAEDLKARCIQHEYDHLEGIMFSEELIGELVHESELQEEADHPDHRG